MIVTEQVAGQRVDVVVIERHYSVREAAKMLCVSVPFIYERIHNGTFAVVEMGDTRSFQRIPASSLQAFIDARRFGGLQASPSP